MSIEQYRIDYQHITGTEPPAGEIAAYSRGYNDGIAKVTSPVIRKALEKIKEHVGFTTEPVWPPASEDFVPPDPKTPNPNPPCFIRDKDKKLEKIYRHRKHITLPLRRLAVACAFSASPDLYERLQTECQAEGHVPSVARDLCYRMRHALEKSPKHYVRGNRLAVDELLENPEAFMSNYGISDKEYLQRLARKTNG